MTVPTAPPATTSLMIGTDSAGQPFRLPPEAVTETFAIVGKRGKGKTYTANVLAEEMLAGGYRIVALDPMGVWWGLRLNADGQTPGYDVYVFGGDHGDLAFGPDDGATLARAIVESDVSAVVDLSRLKKAERLRFVIDFAHTLFDVSRTPRHIFLEEADDYCHERPFLPDARAARSAIEDLVKRGRTRGLGITMVTQRPATIAKDVLTQSEVFIAHALTGPQDRKAVDEWIRANAEPERRDEFLESLARMPRGQGWVWSPGWLETFARVTVRARRTYDASSTPTLEARRQVTLPRLDLRNLEALLAKPVATTESVHKDRLTAQCKGHLERIVGLTRDLEEASGQVAQFVVREQEMRAEAQRWEATANAITEKDVMPLRAKVEALEQQVDGVGYLRRGLVALLGDHAGAVGTPGAIDENGIVERVLARLPTGSAPIVITPPEALRKKYLQAAADRLYAKIAGLQSDALMVMEFLLGQERQFRLADIARTLSGGTSGAAYERWRPRLKELANIGLVEVKKTDRDLYRADIRGCVEADLAGHGATAEEITAVEAQVLYRLSQGNQ